MTAAPGAGPPYSRGVPLSQKKTHPAAHTDRPRLEKLNSICVRFIFQRTEMRIASRASVTTPTSGPNSRTDANAKASDTENRVSIDGIFSVSIPLAIVRIAKRIHSAGKDERRIVSVLADTAAMPTTLTAKTNAFATAGSPFCEGRADTPELSA